MGRSVRADTEWSFVVESPVTALAFCTSPPEPPVRAFAGSSAGPNPSADVDLRSSAGRSSWCRGWIDKLHCLARLLSQRQGAGLGGNGRCG